MQRKTLVTGLAKRRTKQTPDGGRAQPTSWRPEPEAPPEGDGPAPREAGPPEGNAAAAYSDGARERDVLGR